MLKRQTLQRPKEVPWDNAPTRHLPQCLAVMQMHQVLCNFPEWLPWLPSHPLGSRRVSAAGGYNQFFQTTSDSVLFLKLHGNYPLQRTLQRQILSPPPRNHILTLPNLSETLPLADFLVTHQIVG